MNNNIVVILLFILHISNVHNIKIQNNNLYSIAVCNSRGKGNGGCFFSDNKRIGGKMQITLKKGSLKKGAQFKKH